MPLRSTPLTPASPAHAYVSQRTVILATKVNTDRPRAVVAGNILRPRAERRGWRVDTFGIARSRLNSRKFGNTRRFADNTSLEGRQEGGRMTIIINYVPRGRNDESMSFGAWVLFGLIATWIASKIGALYWVRWRSLLDYHLITLAGMLAASLRKHASGDSCDYAVASWSGQ